MSESARPAAPKLVCRDVWKIFGRNPERVLRAVSNVLENARKFAPAELTSLFGVKPR